MFITKELFKLFPAFCEDYLISFEGTNGPVIVPPSTPPLVGLKELHSLVRFKFDIFIESFCIFIFPIKFLRLVMFYTVPAGI